MTAPNELEDPFLASTEGVERLEKQSTDINFTVTKRPHSVRSLTNPFQKAFRDKNTTCKYMRLIRNISIYFL